MLKVTNLVWNFWKSLKMIEKSCNLLFFCKMPIYSSYPVLVKTNLLDD